MAIKPTQSSAHSVSHSVWLRPRVPEAFAVVTGGSEHSFSHLLTTLWLHVPGKLGAAQAGGCAVGWAAAVGGSCLLCVPVQAYPGVGAFYPTHP